MTDDELIYAYLDNQLTADELAGIEQRVIDDPRFARALVEASRQQMFMGRQVQEDYLRNLLPGAGADADNVIAFKAARRPWQLRLAVAALFVCAVAFLLVMQIDAQTPAQDIQWVQVHATESITEQQYQRDGYQIFSKEPSRLTWPDHSYVDLGAQTTCTIKHINGHWILALEHGAVHCVITPQAAGQQFQVATSDLEISVIGTAFRVESRDETSVFVEHGSVAIQDTQGERMVLVANDYVVTNQAQGLLRREVLWSADIINGQLPKQCNGGTLKTDPHRGFVFEAQGKQDFETTSKGVSFQSQSDPLFMYDNDLIFECEYRLNRAGRWIGLWMRGENPVTAHYMSTQSVYDTWHTLRLDLNDIESQAKGQPDLQVDEAVKRIVIMTGDQPQASLEVRALRVYRMRP